MPDRPGAPAALRAASSPLAILAAAAGFSVGAAAGWPIPVAVALAVVAWGARIGVGAIAGRDDDGIDPFQLQDPWRSHVWEARRARRLYQDALRTTRNRAVRDQLAGIEDRIAKGVDECWRVAQQGQALAEARARIDVATLERKRADLQARTGDASEAGGTAPTASTLAETLEAVQAQLDSARRLDDVITSTDAQLGLLDARLGESVTRAIELAAHAPSADDLGGVLADVVAVVGDLESLRRAVADPAATDGAPAPAPAPATPPAAPGVPGGPAPAP